MHIIKSYLESLIQIEDLRMVFFQPEPGDCPASGALSAKHPVL